MEVGFCVEAVEEASACHGKPEIINTDQGSQFINTMFTSRLTDNTIGIGMDAWRDWDHTNRLRNKKPIANAL